MGSESLQTTEPLKIYDSVLTKWFMSWLHKSARQSVACQASVALDNYIRDAGNLVQSLFVGTVFTPAQQEVIQRVIACNKRFWNIAVVGSMDGSPPWKRHIGLNLALLRCYHTQIIAKTIDSGLRQAAAIPPPLTTADAEDALRYCRWSIASYGYRHTPPAFDQDNAEASLLKLAAAIVGVDPDTIVAARLDDRPQAHDPLLPRHLLAVDRERREVIISIRGTASFADICADLLGDPVAFAGGFSHDGFVDAAYRLLPRIEKPLQHALEGLGNVPNEIAIDRKSPRVVLTGHSLGAGVAQILAVLLRGGGDAKRRSKDAWILPSDIKLHMYLYAAPPAYCPNAEVEDASASEIIKEITESAIGFAINFDIIPRTSLHNGYKLFQQVRVVDHFLDWRKRDVARELRRVAVEKQNLSKSSYYLSPTECRIADAVEGAVAAAAATIPAKANPFMVQHSLVKHVYPIVCAAGGIAGRTVEELSESPADFSADLADPTPSSSSRTSVTASQGLCHPRRGHLPSLEEFLFGTDINPRRDGGWLFKKSAKMGTWRRRYAWIEKGRLCFAESMDGPMKSTNLHLTAGNTLIKILGESSSSDSTADLPQTIVISSDSPSWQPLDVFSDDESSLPLSAALGSSALDEGFDEDAVKQRLPTPWEFEVETTSSYGCCPASAPSVKLCTNSAASRLQWLHRLVESINEARLTHFKVQEPLAPADFGREALIGEGIKEDHSTLRYEAALEAALEQCKTVDMQQSANTSP